MRGRRRADAPVRAETRERRRESRAIRRAHGSRRRHADLPRLRLPVPVHRRRRRALVPQPRASGSRPRATRSPTSRCASGRAASDAERAGRATCVAVGPRMALYARRRPAPDRSRRSCSAPACSGTCCATARRYDVVHTASFPYFSLLAAGARAAARAASGSSSTGTSSGRRDYWREYLGARRRARRLARCSALCVRVPPARVLLLAPARARGCATEGLRGEVTVLEGEYAGALERAGAAAGRAASSSSPAATSRRSARRRSCPASPRARERLPGAARRDLRRRPRARRGAGRDRASTGSTDVVEAPGFVDAERGRARRSRRALCLVLPSRREGYGLVVVEAASRGHAERRRRAARTTRRPSSSRRASTASSPRPRRRSDLADGDRPRARGGRRRCARRPPPGSRATRERLSLDSSLDAVARELPAARAQRALVARERRARRCAPR